MNSGNPNSDEWPPTRPYIESKALHLSYLGRDFDVPSIRRYLELSDGSYPTGPLVYYCDESDRDVHGSMLFILNQLEADGYIKTQWKKSVGASGQPCLQLEQLSRTPKGHEYLQELKRRTWLGALKKRSIDLIFSVSAAFLTALVTIWLTKD